MPALQRRELATRQVSVTTQLAQPKAERFPRTLETRHLGTGVLRVRDRVMPRHVAVVTVPDHEHGIVMDLGPEQGIVVAEPQDAHPGGVHEPEVVVGQAEILPLVAWQVADVLAHRGAELCQEQSEANVAGMRLANDADPGHPLPLSRPAALQLRPVLIPVTDRLTGQEPLQRLGLPGLVIPAPDFPPACRLPVPPAQSPSTPPPAHL